MKLLAAFCLAICGLAGVQLAGSLTTSGSHPDDRLWQHSTRADASQCKQFYISLGAAQVADFDRLFIPISPPGSYERDSNGLKLFLDRPQGKITTKGSVNDKVAEGATINSTFTLLHGKVTYTLRGPAVPGVVTAAILIADERDEIDVELVGGDPQHWQTNIFAPAPHDDSPLYGVFSGLESYAKAPKVVSEMHSYTIDWNAERIQWSVDGHGIRTIRRDETKKNGDFHYPSHPARLQLGIWDASAPAGTSEWARGPIQWEHVPGRMSATFESIEVECPY
ncbi:concanavalin A-like lectin/glucanase [Trametes meyenii]|nr:concanavalin A-like lectin/glucanase [Trametes meyenii]